MNNLYPIFTIIVLSVFFSFTSLPQGWSQTLININTSQVVSDHNGENLFDGDLETHWDAGWDLDDYPAFCYVDLGGTYELSKIELYDFAGSGQFKVFAGSPENWDYDAIAVDNLEEYGIWKEHTLHVTTTHLLFRIKTPRSRVSEIKIYGTGTDSAPNQEIIIEVPSTVTMTEGDTRNIAVQTTNATSISAENLPGFINFTDSGNGNGNFDIRPEAGDAGMYNLTLNASHTNGETASANINLTVEAAVEEPDPGPTEGEETLCEVSTSELIFGGGDPGDLVNEQDAIDDPASGPGGNPLSFWFPGWKSRFYPAEGYLDLGSTKTLTRIFLRDINGTGNFKIYAGVPGNWESSPIVDDNLQAYLSWTEHTTPVTTRYLKVVMDDPSSKVSELAIYGYCSDEETTTDEVAPGRIKNLSTLNITGGSVRLRWSASGDDEQTGTATAYDLRYSTSAINAENFSNATAVTIGAPQSAGANEFETITGLDCNTTYYFAIRVSDEAGNSSPVSNVATATTASCEENPVGSKQIVLTLNEAAGSVSVSKSKLKYNKDFAYSFTIDDGSIWDYYIVYPLINGGVSGFPATNPETPWFDFPNDPHIEEAGFSYSDGCGNEVKFKAGLSLNTEHATNEVTNYHITWDNIREMFESDWDVFAHGHTHCNDDCDYDNEIIENRDLLEEYLDFTPTHFVVPSGNENYYEAAYDNGMVAVYDQGYQLPGRNGLSVGEELDFDEFIMYRHPLEIADTPYGEELDMVADLVGDGNYYWISEFAHTVGQPHGGEYHIRVAYDDFKTYLTYIENEYGKPWSDKKIWMAPMQEVHEYLQVRDAVNISSATEGNTMTIYLDDDAVPSGLRRHALSLVVELPEGLNISAVVPNGVTVESYNPETGLLNLNWEE